MFNGCAIGTGFKSANHGETFPALDMLDGGTGSDTWYPYWGADGRWYSTFTDGTVGGVHSQSGGTNPSMHGQVVVEAAGGMGTGNAGDPTDLTIVQAAVFAVNATPFAGNYPTGVFTSNKWQGKDVWYYGTYPVLGGNASKWNENCKNWCGIGPFPGWLWSDDQGQSWHNSGHFPQGFTLFPKRGGGPGDGVTTGGLFGECKGHRVAGGGQTFIDPCGVKFAYPKPVDFGQNNVHSPDGKLYFTAHGATRPDGPVSWMSGDEVHMARVDPALGPLGTANCNIYAKLFSTFCIENAERMENYP